MLIELTSYTSALSNCLFKATNNFENNHTAYHVMRRNNLFETKKKEPLTLRNRTMTSDLMSLLQLVGTVT